MISRRFAIGRAEREGVLLWHGLVGVPEELHAFRLPDEHLTINECH